MKNKKGNVFWRNLEGDIDLKPLNENGSYNIYTYIYIYSNILQSYSNIYIYTYMLYKQIEISKMIV